MILLILAVGCAPAANNAASAPKAPVADSSKVTQAPPADCSALQARITFLEGELANSQALNSKLQKQLDQSAAAVPAKEPVSGDQGSYSMKYDKPALQYPNKYLVWDITGLDCGSFERCTLKSALTNNHPTLTMTNVTINDESIGSAGTNATIKPGETFINTKNLPAPKVVDYQMTLRWVWQ